MSIIPIDEDFYFELVRERNHLRQQVTELQADNTRLVLRARAEIGGGILSGNAIDLAVKRGDIVIDPYRPEHLNPASIDLTLGHEVLTYGYVKGEDQVLDVKKRQNTMRCRIPEDGFVLKPGALYLMHTVERICAKHHVPVIEGKSSIGRLGVEIHKCAGYGDPGYNGQYTLEVTSVYHVRIYAGMRIAQIRFTTLAGEPVDYQKNGHYVGENAKGPVASMAWKQFGDGKDLPSVELPLTEH